MLVPSRQQNPLPKDSPSHASSPGAIAREVEVRELEEEVVVLLLEVEVAIEQLVRDAEEVEGDEGEAVGMDRDEGERSQLPRKTMKSRL